MRIVCALRARQRSLCARDFHLALVWRCREVSWARAGEPLPAWQWAQSVRPCLEWALVGAAARPIGGAGRPRACKQPPSRRHRDLCSSSLSRAHTICLQADVYERHYYGGPTAATLAAPLLRNDLYFKKCKLPLRPFVCLLSSALMQLQVVAPSAQLTARSPPR